MEKNPIITDEDPELLAYEEAQGIAFMRQWVNDEIPWYYDPFREVPKPETEDG